MYVSANKGGSFHIWKQRFPDGAPEQVTSGPTQEQGIAMAADGRSLVTSVGFENSPAWVHDQHGDHQISSEGYAENPQLSHDGRRVYYLVSHADQTDRELWVADVASRATPVLSVYTPKDCGVTGAQYSVSTDEKQGYVFDARQVRQVAVMDRIYKSEFGAKTDNLVRQSGLSLLSTRW